jgi:O-antigen ligase
MNVLALPFPAPQSRTEWIGIGAVTGLVATMQFSIAAAQILLGVAVVAWLVRLRTERRTLEAPAFFWPMAAYGIATLVSAGFSTNPAVSVVDSKQLFLFLIVPVVYDLARGRRADLLLSVVISVGAASALVGVVQYGVLNYDNLGRRMQGTLSHWMTYSGTLMLVICATIARLLFGTRDRLWSAFVLPALVVSLALTLTRGAWVGAAAGAAVLFLVKDFRLTALIPVTVAIALLVAPDALTTRMQSIGDMTDPTTRDRVAMLEAGVAMVRDYPLTGVGPDMVGPLYPTYRTATAVQATNPHLHNVPMQIAAERGLPALGLWLAGIATALVTLWQLRRRASVRPLAATGIGAIVAMFVAGFFEYNFGDSEFLMLLLVLMTLPFAAARGDTATD